MTDEIDGEPISLTAVMMSTDPNAQSKPHLRYNGFFDHAEPFHFDHTLPADSTRIMRHAESLYSRALDPSIKNSEALTTMGELHWWMAHAMPDIRGSAAKTEFSVRSMAQSRGMELPPFKRGFVPDLEAMTTPRSEFVNKYESMFDWKSGSQHFEA